MLAAQGEGIEQMLWRLLRSHQERSAPARRMAEQEEKQERSGLAAQLQDRARLYAEDAEIVRRLLGDRELASAEPA